MRRAHKDRGWDVGVLQEGVFPDGKGRPMQRRLVGKAGRLEDVVQGAHEGQPQAPPARSPAPVQGGPADAPFIHESSCITALRRNIMWCMSMELGTVLTEMLGLAALCSCVPCARIVS